MGPTRYYKSPFYIRVLRKERQDWRKVGVISVGSIQTKFKTPGVSSCTVTYPPSPTIGIRRVSEIKHTDKNTARVKSSSQSSSNRTQMVSTNMQLSPPCKNTRIPITQQHQATDS